MAGGAHRAGSDLILVNVDLYMNNMYYSWTAERGPRFVSVPVRARSRIVPVPAPGDCDAWKKPWARPPSSSRPANSARSKPPLPDRGSRGRGTGGSTHETLARFPGPAFKLLSGMMAACLSAARKRVTRRSACQMRASAAMPPVGSTLRITAQDGPALRVREDRRLPCADPCRKPSRC